MRFIHNKQTIVPTINHYTTHSFTDFLENIWIYGHISNLFCLQYLLSYLKKVFHLAEFNILEPT